jgi:hypothetical protein
MLNYYGGFEYVDSEDRMLIGRYVVFFGNSSRVQTVIDALDFDEE